MKNRPVTLNSRNKGSVVESTKLKSIRCSNLRRCSTNRAETNRKIKVLNARTPLHHSAESNLLLMTISEMATGHLGLKVCSISSEIDSRTAKFNSKVVCLGEKKKLTASRLSRKIKSFPVSSSGESKAASAMQQLLFAGGFFFPLSVNS